jgi:hypothetical protein
MLVNSVPLSETIVFGMPRSAITLSGADFGGKLRALNPAKYYEGPSYAASVSRIRKVLTDAKMGLQVYLAGTEGLMGQALEGVSETLCMRLSPCGFDGSFVEPFWV